MRTEIENAGREKKQTQELVGVAVHTLEGHGGFLSVMLVQGMFPWKWQLALLTREIWSVKLRGSLQTLLGTKIDRLWNPLGNQLLAFAFLSDCN
jgi:hypothetical protein